jgi:tetratricopeptide (TPR) repeat protein
MRRSKMKKIFKKKEIFKVKSLPVDPTTMGEPKTIEEYQKRGMAYYARKQFDEAIADLNKAIAMDANNIDSYYSLGMVFKASNDKDHSVSAFKKAIELIQARSDTPSVKFDMLRRLALGHVNEIIQGDWNLEKEIWKHTQ